MSPQLDAHGPSARRRTRSFHIRAPGPRSPARIVRTCPETRPDVAPRSHGLCVPLGTFLRTCGPHAPGSARAPNLMRPGQPHTPHTPQAVVSRCAVGRALTCPVCHRRRQPGWGRGRGGVAGAAGGAPWAGRGGAVGWALRAGVAARLGQRGWGAAGRHRGGGCAGYEVRRALLGRQDAESGLTGNAPYCPRYTALKCRISRYIFWRREAMSVPHVWLHVHSRD